MGKVSFSISEELFIDAMHMPEDTKIKSTVVRTQFGYTIIEIIAEHSDIPGEDVIHETTPRVSGVGYCKECYKPTTLEWDWNIKGDEVIE